MNPNSGRNWRVNEQSELAEVIGLSKALTVRENPVGILLGYVEHGLVDQNVLFPPLPIR